MVIASYSIENDKKFGDSLDKAAKTVGDLRIALGLIARDWFKSNKAQFSLQGSGQYPPLSAKYAEAKRKSVGRKPILVRSGKLRDSMTDLGSADSIVKIGKTSMMLGTQVAHGIYHQSDQPRSKIPLRKFLFIGPEAPRSAPSAITGRLQRWMNILDAEINRKLKAGI